MSYVQIERRMELVRLVSHNTHKRLVSCLQGQLGTDTEKRHVRSTSPSPTSSWPVITMSYYLSYILQSQDHCEKLFHFAVRVTQRNAGVACSSYRNWIRVNHCDTVVRIRNDLLSCARNTLLLLLCNTLISLSVSQEKNIQLWLPASFTITAWQTHLSCRDAR